MILMPVPALALLLGLLLGGQPQALLALRVRWLGLALAAFALQWLLVRVVESAPVLWLGAAFAGSTGLVALVCWRNRALPGVKLALVGTLLNLAVMSANGGYMPVTPATFTALGHPVAPAQIGQHLIRGKDVLLPPEQTSLVGLGDNIVIPALGTAFSLGDILLAFGLGWLILAGMQPRRLPRLARAPAPG